MNKQLLITVLLTFSTLILVAQGRYDKCYFGTAGIDFTGGNPTALTNSQMIGKESPAAMSSINGDLLFYTNGGDSPLISGSFGAVWNANHEVMENGILSDESGCLSSYQGAVAFPSSPSTNFTESSIYYIFMRDCVESSFASNATNSGLTYCEIDMGANNGLGKVISKGNTALPFDDGFGYSTNHEPVAAISNANEDAWYVFSYNLDSLYSITVNNNGVSGYKSHVEGSSRIVFSPSKEHVVVGNILYNYDNLNNELSIIRSLPESTFAFSPNGAFIYGLNGDTLCQYDLTVSNILNSKISISNNVSANKLYLAPDARIYLFNKDSGSLPGVINCPNSIGTSCGLAMTPFDLAGKSSGQVFTNIPANYLYYDGADCNLTVNNIKNNLGYQLFPNPTNQKITISINAFKKPLQFEIHSLDGKSIHKQTIRSSIAIIDLSYLNSGMYITTVNGIRKTLIVD